MTIGEFQELIVYAITTGVFLGLIISFILSVFGKRS